MTERFTSYSLQLAANASWNARCALQAADHTIYAAEIEAVVEAAKAAEAERIRAEASRKKLADLRARVRAAKLQVEQTAKQEAAVRSFLNA